LEALFGSGDEAPKRLLHDAGSPTDGHHSSVSHVLNYERCVRSARSLLIDLGVLVVL
jgi:hypothetical protein